MEEKKIWIGISKKDIEREIEKIVREHTRRLVDYKYVQNVFYSELCRFAKSKKGR